MAPKRGLWGIGLAALLAAAVPARAGGPGLELERLHGTVEIKSLAKGGRWRPARPGELVGEYLLRTGPRSWVRLREAEAPRYQARKVGCVDPHSVVRVSSNCGYKIEVVQGKVSAPDGRPGPTLFRVASR